MLSKLSEEEADRNNALATLQMAFQLNANPTILMERNAYLISVINNNYQQAIVHLKKVYTATKAGKRTGEFVAQAFVNVAFVFFCVSDDPSKKNYLRELCALYIQIRSLKEFLESRRTLLVEESKANISWFGFSLASYLNGDYKTALDVIDKFIQNESRPFQKVKQRRKEGKKELIRRSWKRTS